LEQVGECFYVNCRSRRVFLGEPSLPPVEFDVFEPCKMPLLT